MPEFHGGSTRAGLLTTLALLSGCCALAYEILYMRALTTILGDMFYVHAALLSTFLVGIGLGAKVAHRWLHWLWAFEMLTGLYALGLPVASRWLSEQPVMGLITSSPFLTIFATVGFLSVPSLLIGFSIPLFSAYIKSCSPERLAFRGSTRSTTWVRSSAFSASSSSWSGTSASPALLPWSERSICSTASPFL